MNAANTCSQCHNTTFHFDRNRHAVVCDVCGTSLSSSNDANEQLEYDKNRRKAIALIKARDYQAAKTPLDNMYKIMPDDSDIFYLHLMGLTDCCKDYLLSMNDNAKLLQAQDYWKTFRSLNGDPTLFISYGEQRRKILIHLVEKELSKLIIIAFICYVLLFFCLTLLFFRWYYAAIGVVIMVALIVYFKPIINIYNNVVKRKYHATSTTPFEQNL